MTSATHDLQKRVNVPSLSIEGLWSVLSVTLEIGVEKFRFCCEVPKFYSEKLKYSTKINE